MTSHMMEQVRSVPEAVRVTHGIPVEVVPYPPPFMFLQSLNLTSPPSYPGFSRHIHPRMYPLASDNFPGPLAYPPFSFHCHRGINSGAIGLVFIVVYGLGDWLSGSRLNGTNLGADPW